MSALTSHLKLPGIPALRWLIPAIVAALSFAQPAAGQAPNAAPQAGTPRVDQFIKYQPQAGAPAPSAPARPPAALSALPSSPAQHFADFAEAEPLVTRPNHSQLASYQGSSQAGGGEEALNALSGRVDALEKSGQSAKREARGSGAGGSFEHNLFGRIQADTVTFGQSPANIKQVGHAPNGTNFRRARLGMQGIGHDVYFYRFEVDFSGPGQVIKQVPRVTDAYAEIRKLPFGTLRMGEFRVPLSTERIMSANDLTFIERGLPQAFNPARQLGMMAYNSTENYFFSWYSDISTWKATNQGQQYGKAGRVNLTQRFVFLPWYDEPSDGRYLFHIGGAYEYQDVRNDTFSYGTTPEAVLNYGSASVIPNFISTGNITARDVQILQAEASTVLGPLSFQAEYYGVFVDPTVNPANKDLFFSGWYVYGSFFLTGEHRVWNRDQAYYTAVKPFTNFFRVRGSDGSVIQGPGAWEIAARASQMNLSDRSVQGGLLNDFTLALNWYLTPQLRVMADYVYVVNNVHNKQTYADIFETRAQVVW